MVALTTVTATKNVVDFDDSDIERLYQQWEVLLDNTLDLASIILFRKMMMKWNLKMRFLVSSSCSCHCGQHFLHSTLLC